MSEFNQNKSNVCIQITLNFESHFSQFNVVFGSHFDRLSHHIFFSNISVPLEMKNVQQ